MSNSKQRIRNWLGTGLFAVLLAGGMLNSHARDFPDGPITWIVNWPAGGGQDTTSRIVADKLAGVLGVPIVIENHSGAGGLAGMRVLAGSTPDGYTIGMLGASSVVQQYTHDAPVMLDELTFLSFFGPDPAALTVHGDFPVATLAEYVAKAEQAPGSILNGNDPPGGASYISASIMETALGISLTKVPYEGFAPTVTALLAGEVNSATVPIPQVSQYHDAGTVRILGVMANERHFMTPEVPTFREQGFDVLAGDFRAVVAPAGIPEERKAILADALLAVMSDPALVERANAAGYMVEAMDAEATLEYVRAFDERVYPVLEAAGLVENPR